MDDTNPFDSSFLQEDFSSFDESFFKGLKNKLPEKNRLEQPQDFKLNLEDLDFSKADLDWTKLGPSYVPKDEELQAGGIFETPTGELRISFAYIRHPFIKDTPERRVSLSTHVGKRKDGTCYLGVAEVESRHSSGGFGHRMREMDSLRGTTEEVEITKERFDGLYEKAVRTVAVQRVESARLRREEADPPVLNVSWEEVFGQRKFDLSMDRTFFITGCPDSDLVGLMVTGGIGLQFQVYLARVATREWVLPVPRPGCWSEEDGPCGWGWSPCHAADERFFRSFLQDLLTKVC